MKEMKVYRVEGMTCNHCKATVENGISEKYAAGKVQADPEKNALYIEDDSADDETVQAIIERLGYVFKGRRD